MNLPLLNDADKLMLSRVDDYVFSASEKYSVQFSHFLDERHSAMAVQRLKALNFSNYLLWGGDDGCERLMLGAFPQYEEPSHDVFPISAISFTFRKEDKLSHRDFLGAIMNLMIKRESVGDIMVGDGLAVSFVQKKVAPLLLGELSKIGRTGIKVYDGMPFGLPPKRGYQEISGTVSALRLDCIVALLTDLSREKSAELIKSGAVSVMFAPCEDVSVQLDIGSKISIRGFGRYIIDSAGGLSKKGRLHVMCKKFL